MTRRRHEEAVIQAEIRRLAKALAPSRVLEHDALRRNAVAPLPTAATPLSPHDPSRQALALEVDRL